MAFPTSTPVSAGETGTITQYNNLRDDALYPSLQSFTYGETIAVNDAVYLKVADGKVWKTDADFNDEKIYNFVGFAKEAGNADDVKEVQTAGKVEGFTGLTIGSYYYLSNTAGGVTVLCGVYPFIAGLAISSSEIIIVKKRPYVYPTLDLQHSNDTERDVYNSRLTYTKMKEIKYDGSTRLDRIRITFAAKTTSSGTFFIHKNGVSLESFSISSSWVTCESEVGHFSPNDLIQIYTYHPDYFITSYAKDFRLYFMSDIMPLNFTNQDL